MLGTGPKLPWNWTQDALALDLRYLAPKPKEPWNKANRVLELRSWGLGALLLWLELLCSFLSESFMGLRGRQLLMALVTK